MTRRIPLACAALLVLAAGAFLGIGRRHRHERPPAGAETARYQCPMHPAVVSDKPGLCPICHMELQKVEEAPGAGSPDGADPVPGHAAFSLSTERRQLIGVKTAPVEFKELEVEIRAVGKIAYDPELYAALAEYREAVSAKEKIKDSSWPDAHERAAALVKAAALKLKLLGISQETIAAASKDAADSTSLLLPGKKVWVYAQVFEYEVDLIRPGQAALVSAPSMPGRGYRGKVAAIDPVINPATRSVRVRVEIETPEGRLRPESFVQVRIRVPLGRRLAIPENALLDTGEQQIVFVVKEGGRFEPRGVTVGREAEGHYEILAGLEDGERIVSSANFLIDSESRFRSALESFSSPGPAHAGH